MQRAFELVTDQLAIREGRFFVGAEIAKRVVAFEIDEHEGFEIRSDLNVLQLAGSDIIGFGDDIEIQLAVIDIATGADRRLRLLRTRFDGATKFAKTIVVPLN